MIRLYEMHHIPVDEKLISQYLQNHKIASDFAVYYDLYNKYKSDYQVEDILAGKASGEIKGRAKRAQFDERYALIGLMLDAVMTEMHSAIETEDVLAALNPMLRRLKSELQLKPGKENALYVLNQIYQEQDLEYQKGMKSKSISREQQTQFVKIMEILQAEIRLINEDNTGDSFGVIKEDYSQRLDVFQHKVDRAKRHTTNVFKFSDEVFKDGQELTVLVTELTINPHSARFISTYRVEEYFIHDKQLMFHQRQLEILKEIKNLQLD